MKTQVFFQPHPLFSGGTRQSFFASYWNTASWIPHHQYTQQVKTTDNDIIIVNSHLQMRSPQNYADVFLVHGLTGDARSMYMLRLTSEGLQRGFNVHRLNLRAAGPCATLSRLHYHAGLWQDVLDAVRTVRIGKKAFLLGISLGGNVILKMAGDLAENIPKYIGALVAISAPLDLSTTEKYLQQNKFFQWCFVYLLIRHYQQRSALFPEIYKGRLPYRPHTVREYDEHVVAPVHGFKNAEQYYQSCSCGKVLQKISVPALLIHAEDDPIVPWFQYQDYRRVLVDNKYVSCDASKYGGHVGFITNNSSCRFWAERRALDFFSHNDFFKERAMLRFIAIWTLLILVTTGAAQEESTQFPFVYRGYMGNFAVFEHTKTGAQKLVKVGDQVDSYRITRITPQKVVCLGVYGEIAIAKDINYTVPQQLSSTTYPFQWLMDREKIFTKLETTMLSLAWQDTPLHVVLLEISQLLSIPIVIAPEIYENPQQLLAITLHTDEISARKALNLLATYFEISYFVEQTRIVFTHTHATSTDPATKYLQGLRHARQQILLGNSAETATQTTVTSFENKLQQKITLSLLWSSLEEFAQRFGELLECAVILAPEISGQLRKVSVEATEVAAQEVLDYLCREQDLMWTLKGRSVYLAPAPAPDRIATEEQLAEASAIEQAENLEQWWQQTIQLPKGRLAIAQLVSICKAQQIQLIVGPQIWQKEYVYIVDNRTPTLRAILDKISQDVGATYVLLEGVLYLLSQSAQDF